MTSACAKNYAHELAQHRAAGGLSRLFWLSSKNRPICDARNGVLARDYRSPVQRAQAG